VRPRTIADAAGLRPGDVLTEFATSPVGSDGTMAGFCDTLLELPDPTNASVQLVRDGQRLSGLLDGTGFTDLGGITQWAATTRGWSEAELIGPDPAVSPWLVAADDGSLRLVYSGGGRFAGDGSGAERGIYYATDRSGEWVVEQVSDGWDFAPNLVMAGKTPHIVFSRSPNGRTERSIGIMYGTKE
jgi:hypothetical protein